MEEPTSEFTSDFEDIPFKYESQEASTYVPYTPTSVLNAIQPLQHKPPLILDPKHGAPAPINYTVGSLSVSAMVRFPDYNMEVPLAMCSYIKPKGDSIYNYEMCREVNFENMLRENHNKFMIDLFCEFMQANDCSSSAGKMTAPEQPPDFGKIRLAEIKKFSTDKLGTTEKSITYLAARDIYCGRDYAFSGAFEKANSVCFDEIVAARKATGKVRVRLEGHPPSWWDGISDKDQSGCRVEWCCGIGHTYLTPNVVVVKNERYITADRYGVETNGTICNTSDGPAVEEALTNITSFNQI